ncbi:MAG: O-antigen ligase family protein, partial [Planctomycetes bacterium]|nr:O-antigen ligase family protein [Planctomycetota bacterium]
AIVIVLLGATTVIAANPTILLERFSDLGSSQGARWTFWSTTLAAALRQPLLGFGIGTHPVAYHPFQPAEIAGQVHHAHNEYVNAAFEGGAVWIALLLAGMVAWFARARRATRTAQGPDRIVGAAALAAVAAVAVHSLVDFDLQITAVGLLFATLIGTAPRGDAPPRRFVAPAVALVGLAVAAVLAFAPLRALALSPYDHALAWKHAREAQRADSPALADRRFEKAADLWPAHPDLQREAGLWFWEGGQRDRAAKCLRRLFSQRPRDVAGVMDEIWDPERDVAEYEVLLPPGPAARAEMAGALVDRGYWRQGMELFDRGPADAAAFDAFAGALRRAGQWGLEADVRDRRLQMKSDAAAYAAAAQAWSRLDAYERALEHATTATRLDPANAAWHAIKGEILRAHGDRMSALEAVVEAVRLAPRELATRILRARLYVDLEMWGPAAEDVAEITRSRPAFPQSPEAAAARKAAEAYVKRHPDDAAAQGLLRALTP